MKISEFIKLLAAVDDIRDVIDDMSSDPINGGIISDEHRALHKEISPVLTDLVEKFLNHAHKYLR